MNLLLQTKVKPNDINTNLEGIGSATIKESTAIYNLIKRPELNIFQIIETCLRELPGLQNSYSKEIFEQSITSKNCIKEYRIYL